MFFSSAVRLLLCCFGSNSSNNNNRGLATPTTISGPRNFTHKRSGNPDIPLRAFVSTRPPYVQPERL
ncbi:unnamed protein product [Aureobasidium uvarum]|uniref:Secreted protein n=1 Tax=Aureobasidium uvarum TaxID=2773716 RepID=A0A9N8PQD4_9PEZI|nr:unnamed protein product [Aureobasidium uvarum]